MSPGSLFGAVPVGGRVPGLRPERKGDVGRRAGDPLEGVGHGATLGVPAALLVRQTG